MNNNFNGPLFIVGLSRSGTKLLRDLLNRNAFVSLPEVESQFIPKLLKNNLSIAHAHKYISNTLFVKRYPKIKFPSIDHLESMKKISSVEDLIETLLKYYSPDKNDSWNKDVIWGDKTPLYLRHLDLLKEHYPNCKVVHIIRDPRDRAISVKKTWGKSMYRTTEKWRTELQNSQKWRNNKEFLFELHYEDLLDNTSSKIKEICNFLQIPFQDQMLSLSKPSEKHGDNSKKLQVNTTNKQKYKSIDKSVVKRIEEIAYPMMLEYGYSPLYGTQLKRFSPILMETLKYTDYLKFKVNNKLKGY